MSRHRFPARACRLLPAALVAAALVVVPQHAHAADTPVDVYLTTPDRQNLLTPGTLAFDRDEPGQIDLGVDAGQRYQQLLGVGASLTEASAELITALPAAQRDQLMVDLFDPVDGVGIDYLRQPAASNDFVARLPFFSYDDSDTPDPDLEKFSISRDEEQVLPLLRDAVALNPDLRFMGSPWSAPAWMKDSGDLSDGSLLPEYHEVYADYLVKFVQAYGEAGVPISELTVGNEPLFGTTYPSMVMSPQQQAEVLRVLDGKLAAAGLDTRLFAYDHNWDRPDYPLEVLAAVSDVERVVGAAFHCYGGEPEAQQQVRDAGWRVVFTECSGTDSADPASTFADTLAWQTENLAIRSIRSGSETLITWNLALDARGGPHFGHCDDRCNGVVEVEGDSYTHNAEYYIAGHLGKFTDRGATRVESATQGPGGVQSVAFENPDGSRVLLALNAAEADRTFTVSENGRSFEYTLPAGAVATFAWGGPPE